MSQRPPGRVPTYAMAVLNLSIYLLYVCFLEAAVLVGMHNCT